MRILILAFLYLSLQGCDIRRKEAEQKYEAGFKIIKSVDRTRIYKPSTTSTDYLHYRPMDIDVWYPAIRSGTDTVLRFHDILGLLEQRAAYYTNSDVSNGLTHQLADYFTEGFHCADSSTLLNFKTASIRNAAAVQTKFPLVIYLCAYNGMSYENYRLFETLASEGFIVMSVSSIGRYPGDMTMKQEDLLEQVLDAQASLNILKQDPNVDSRRIGIIGYSWGGMAAALLAERVENVKCILSLDGSEFHHYGNSVEEDTDFERIRTGKLFQNLLLTIPYLRLESSPNKSAVRDSIYHFNQKVAGELAIYTIDSTEHQDFGSMSLVVREAGNCAGRSPHETMLQLATAFMQKELQQKPFLDEIISGKLDKTIRKKQ